MSEISFLPHNNLGGGYVCPVSQERTLRLIGVTRLAMALYWEEVNASPGEIFPLLNKNR